MVSSPVMKGVLWTDLCEPAFAPSTLPQRGHSMERACTTNLRAPRQALRCGHAGERAAAHPPGAYLPPSDQQSRRPHSRQNSVSVNTKERQFAVVGLVCGWEEDEFEEAVVGRQSAGHPHNTVGARGVLKSESRAQRVE